MNWKMLTIVLFALIGVGFSLDAPVITSPADGAVISATKFNVTWNAVSGAGCYKVKEDDVPLQPYSVNLYYERTDVSEGSHTYTVQSDDETCNPMLWDGGISSAITVYINRTAPTVSVLSPTAATKGASATFSSQVTDTNGVTACNLLFGSTSLSMSLSSGDSKSGTWSVSHAPTAEGNITTKVNCTDVAGNAKETTTTVNVAGPITDTTAPTSIVHITPLSPKIGDSITFTATATDNTAVKNITLYIDGVTECAAASTSCTVSKSYSTNGTHEYYARACDVFSNCADSSKNMLTVTTEQQTPPSGNQEQLFIEILGPNASVEYVEEDAVQIEAAVKNQTGNVTDATVTVSGACSMVLMYTDGKYTGACTATLGSTDVIISASKGSASATNTTTIVVKCKPKATITQDGLTVNIDVKCGTAAYSGNFVAKADGSDLTLNKISEGTYSGQLPEGNHSLLLQFTEYGKTFEQTQDVSTKPAEGSAFAFFNESTFGIDNKIWIALGLVGAIAAVFFFFNKATSRSTEKAVKVAEKKMDEISMKKDLGEYVQAEASLRDYEKKKNYLTLKMYKRWISEDELEDALEKAEKERRTCLDNKTVILKRYPDFGTDAGVKDLVDAAVESRISERLREIRKRLVAQAADSFTDGASKEQILKNLSSWSETLPKEELQKIVDEGIAKAKKG